jgi:hypothetical protein
MKRGLFLAVILCLATAPAHAAGKITVSGYINSCYSYGHPAVYLKGKKLETPVTPADKTGHFTIEIPSKGFHYGSYALYFGEGSDKEGFGMKRIDIRGKSTDAGIVGECDL